MEESTASSNQSTNDTGNEEENIFKIMIASDIHLGYKETDKERGEDSFTAFEEILQIAVANGVDFILLGGDLFDKANPSSYCLNRCIQLLRTYCMGEKPILFEFLSDQSLNFAESLHKTVNYEDENLNIAIPVFSISGNHDDSSGYNNLSALDLLSTSGLVNYFGKFSTLQSLEIYPIMLQKGTSKLALYGLNYIQDNRLFRLFADKKIKMAIPEDHQDWFNIFVLHQNRANRGFKNYLPEEALPDFLDFILWGHEHDCRISPEQNGMKQFFVSQPGSSVATSLADGESGEKRCALLYVRGKDFKMEEIRLKSVRPFVFDTMNVAKLLDEEEKAGKKVLKGTIDEHVMELTRLKVEEMLKKAEELRTDHPKQPKLPLLRLRVEIQDTNQMFQSIRFGQTFAKFVANCEDIILFRRITMRRLKNDVNVDGEAFDEAYTAEDKADKVEDIVKQYFDNSDDSKTLRLISVDAMNELTRSIIESKSRTDTILEYYKTEGRKYIEDTNEENFEQKMDEFRGMNDNIFKGLLKNLDAIKTKEMALTDLDLKNDLSDDENSSTTTTDNKKKTTTSRGRGKTETTTTRGRGRGSRGGRGRAAAAAATPTNTRQNPLNFTSRPKTSASGTIFLDSDDSN